MGICMHELPAKNDGKGELTVVKWVWPLRPAKEEDKGLLYLQSILISLSHNLLLPYIYIMTSHLQKIYISAELPFSRRR